MGFTRRNSISFVSILIIFGFWLKSFIDNKEYYGDPIQGDVKSYYSYLPTLYIYKDVKLKFLDTCSAELSANFWPTVTPEGKKVFKTTMGLSYAYTPFFLVADWYAHKYKYEPSGYSLPYRISVLISSITFLMIGLFYLRNFLLNFFSDIISALVISTIFFATNLFHYATKEAAMSHCFLFSITAIYLYYSYRWHQYPKVGYGIATGLLLGTATLIRPTQIILLLPFIFYNVYSFSTLKNKLLFFLNHKLQLLVLLFFAFVPMIPQLLYWHAATGHWVCYSYTGERFYFDHPHIVEGLFSYRKGWLLYTPVMIFAFIGLLINNEKTRGLRLPVFLTLATCVYVFYSWWTWWFGGSFSSRPMIDYYALFAIPIGNTFVWVKNRNKIFQVIGVIILYLLMKLNTFQAWQYREGFLHYDSMNKKTYWAQFLSKRETTTYKIGYRYPDYLRAKAGLPFEYPPTHPEREYLTIQDFELNTLADDGITSEITNGGKYSCCLSNACPYSNPAIFEVSDLMQYRADSIFIIVDLFAKQNFGTDELAIVASVENDSSVYAYHTSYFQIPKSNVNKWIKVDSKLVFQAKDVRDRMRVYVWNRTNKKVYVDNVFIEFKQRERDPSEKE